MLLLFKINKIRICLLICVLFSVCSNGQRRVVVIDSIPSKENFIVSSFYGASTSTLDSFKTTPTKILLPENYIGFIRIQSKDQYEDFIVDDDSLIISLLPISDKKWKGSTNSRYNIWLNELKRGWKEYTFKINQTNDSSLKESIAKRRMLFSDSLLNIESESFFSISTTLALISTDGLSANAIIDLIPFLNGELVNCSLIPNMIIKAVKAIPVKDDDLLIELINYIYSMEMNKEVQKMVSSFLLNFLTETNSDNVLNYFVNNIINDNYCEFPFSKNSEYKIRQIELYKTGNTLPDIMINKTKISTLLKKYKKKNIVIFVWSQECPHCINMLNNFKGNKNSIYFGIEISNIKTPLTYPFFSLQIKDGDGWEGQLAKEWMINKTPTIIKADHNLKILKILRDLE